MIDNRSVYDSDRVVSEYSREDQLTKPESAILEIIRARATRERMLDIGVGPGRTTLFFAPIFKLNRSKEELLRCDHAEIHDDHPDFSAVHVYGKPEYQLEQLKAFDFCAVLVFALKEGEDITQTADWKMIEDPWLYYYCVNDKSLR